MRWLKFFAYLGDPKVSTLRIEKEGDAFESPSENYSTRDILTITGSQGEYIPLVT
jgi:hypothetical protein